MNYTKQIKFIKVLSIIALCCTIILWIALWLSSATDGGTSKIFTDKVTSFVDSHFNVTSKIEQTLKTQSVEIHWDYEKYYFIDETLDLSTSYYPENAVDKDVEYLVSNEKVATVDQNGKLTFLSNGSVKVTTQLKSNPQINDSIILLCYGEDLFASQDKQTLTIQDADKVFYTNTNRHLLLNKGKTKVNAAKFASSDENIVAVFDGVLFARSEGSATIYADINHAGKSLKLQTEVTITQGQSTPIQSLKLAKPFIVTDKENIIDFRNYFEIEEGRSINDYYVFAKSSNPKILEIGGTTLMPHDIGDVELTFTSPYNKDLNLSCQ